MIAIVLGLNILALGICFAFGRRNGYWKGYYEGCQQGHADACRQFTPRKPAPRRVSPCIAEPPLTQQQKAGHARVAAMFPVLK